MTGIIEQVIEQLELDGHHELVTEIKIKYSSLITTIDSQKETIEMLTRQMVDEVTLHAKSCVKIESQKSEIEGYKAITELAVKGLRDQRLRMLEGEKVGFESETVFWTRCIFEIDDTVSEIARLSHAQT